MYCTAQDMIARFSESEMIVLTDRNHTGAIDAVVVERALTDAAAEINGYLAARYQMPLTSTPTVLVRVCADIARYLLHDDNIPDVVGARYKAAVELLRQVANGRVSLGVSEAGNAPTSSDGAKVESGGTVWGRNASKGFI